MLFQSIFAASFFPLEGNGASLKELGQKDLETLEKIKEKEEAKE